MLGGICTSTSEGQVVLLQAGSCQMALVPVVWLLSFHMWALFGHMQAVVIRMPIIWLKFLAPELVFNFNMAKEWQVMMVTFILSKTLNMGNVQRRYFLDDLDNLRDVVASILTYCGERLVSLSELWSLLTACKCLQDQVSLATTIPAEDQITFVLDEYPTTGAARMAALGGLHELRLCPYRAALCDDMLAGIRFAQSLRDQGCNSHEFQQVQLFLADAQEYLFVLGQLNTMND